ncbi:MAG: pilus assembly protein [Firmicutes bacterium]|nr:pilus assembly protein [Bacillota bacterium]
MHPEALRSRLANGLGRLAHLLRPRRSRRGRLGQALVEFALIAPVLFLLILGGIGLFLFSDANSTVLRAAQAGAQAAGTGQDCNTIQSVVFSDINQGLGMTSRNIQSITVDESNTSVVANANLSPLLGNLIGSTGVQLGDIVNALEQSILSMGTTQWTWTSTGGWSPPRTPPNPTTVLSTLSGLLGQLLSSGSSKGITGTLLTGILSDLGVTSPTSSSPNESCQVSLGPLVIPPLLESGTVTVTVTYSYTLPIPLPGIGSQALITRSWSAPYGSNALNIQTE